MATKVLSAICNSEKACLKRARAGIREKALWIAQRHHDLFQTAIKGGPDVIAEELKLGQARCPALKTLAPAVCCRLLPFVAIGRR
jgi:hypothetical protein